jgi:hypothetical protein
VACAGSPHPYEYLARPGLWLWDFAQLSGLRADKLEGLHGSAAAVPDAEAHDRRSEAPRVVGGAYSRARATRWRRRILPRASVFEYLAQPTAQPISSAADSACLGAGRSQAWFYGEAAILND